jgi:hypothetical protein
MKITVSLILIIAFIFLGDSQKYAEIEIIDNRKLLNANNFPIINISTIFYDKNIKIFYDPPNHHVSPTALAVFVRSNLRNSKIYYDTTGHSPTLNSSYATYNQPYIQLTTAFRASRNNTLIILAVNERAEGIFRSNPIVLHYFVESAARPYSFGFLVPGLESGGYFIKFGLEMTAIARAQVVGQQEFANFSSNLGKGTYLNQITALDLLSLDADLKGFEGGFSGSFYYYYVLLL